MGETGHGPQPDGDFTILTVKFPYEIAGPLAPPIWAPLGTPVMVSA